MITAAQAKERLAAAREAEVQRERDRAIEWCECQVALDIETRSDAQLSFVSYDLETRRFNNTFISTAVAFLKAFDFTVSVEDLGNDIRITIEWPTDDQAA